MDALTPSQNNPAPVELSPLQAAWLLDHDIDFLWGQPLAQQFAAAPSDAPSAPVASAVSAPAPSAAPEQQPAQPAPVAQPAPEPAPAPSAVPEQQPATAPVKTIAATLAPAASARPGQAVLRVEGREGAPILILGMSTQSAQRLQKPFQDAQERQLLRNIAQHFGGSLEQDFSLIEIAGCVEAGKPLLERFNTCRETLQDTIKTLKPKVVLFGGSLLPNWCIPQLIAQPVLDLKQLRHMAFTWQIDDFQVAARVSIPVHIMLGTTAARRQACLDWCRLQAYLRGAPS